MSKIPNSQRLKLPHSMIVKSAGLLPMLYTPDELARALEILIGELIDFLSPHVFGPLVQNPLMGINEPYS